MNLFGICRKEKRFFYGRSRFTVFLRQFRQSALSFHMVEVCILSDLAQPHPDIGLSTEIINFFGSSGVPVGKIRGRNAR